MQVFVRQSLGTEQDSPNACPAQNPLEPQAPDRMLGLRQSPGFLHGIPGNLLPTQNPAALHTLLKQSPGFLHGK